MTREEYEAACKRAIELRERSMVHGALSEQESTEFDKLIKVIENHVRGEIMCKRKLRMKKDDFDIVVPLVFWGLVAFLAYGLYEVFNLAI